MTGPGQARMPVAEVEVDEVLVARLLREQHPDLARLRLRPAGNGWDNFVYRLGPELAVRLPRRAAAIECLRNEVRWLPGLVPGLPVPVPVAERTGVAGAGYPWPWAVCRWVPGRPATQAPFQDPVTAAAALADFQRELHRPAPPEAPFNPVRGVSLAAREGALKRAREALPGSWNPNLDRLWQMALAAPSHAGPGLWLHGDPHPGNLVTRAGQLAGVIDFGDICAGDPATDLAAAWLAFPPVAHGPLREHADELGPGTWLRARGWAVALAMAITANSADNSELARVGTEALNRLAAEQAD
jgi:aminoglycoside phosphotransferase (APT) family kinase protein